MPKFYTQKFTVSDATIRNEKDLWRAMSNYEDAHFDFTGEFPEQLFAKPPTLKPILEYYQDKAKNGENYFNMQEIYDSWVQTDDHNSKKEHEEHVETACAYWGCASLKELVDLGYVLSCSKNIEEGRFFLFQSQPFKKGDK